MRQKTWKKRLALVLAASMTLNAGVMTSFADTKTGWQKEADGWHYYYQDGSSTGEGIRNIRDRWYYFDEDQVMVSGRLVETNMGTFYPSDEEGELNGAFVSNKWVFTGGEWYRFGELKIRLDGASRWPVGNLVTERLKQVHGKWYSFGENGVMRSNQLIKDIVDGETFYADLSGALVSRNWRLLDKNGKACIHDSLGCGCSWYFFGDIDNKKGMAEDENKKELSDGIYAFDQDGRMLSREWWLEDGKRVNYYQFEGVMAADKWLPFEEEGVWYHFDADGNVDKRTAIEPGKSIRPVLSNVASVSDAEKEDKIVRSVKPMDTDINADVEEHVELKFQLATSSNAVEEDNGFNDNHDVWVSKLKEGKTKYVGISDDGVCTIEYWNVKENTDGEKVYLYVDGVRSATPVTVHTKASESVDNDTVIDNAIDKLDPDQLGEMGIEEKADVAVQIKDSYAGTSDDKKEEVQDAFLNAPSTLGDLEAAYITSNGLTPPQKTVTDEAKKLLGENADKVTMVGGALNAENPGDTVELKLEAPSTKEEDLNSALSQAGEEIENIEKVALDLTFLLNNAPQGQLKVPVVITMPLPEGFKDATEDDMKLFNIHDGVAKSVKFKITVEGEITFVTDKFSTYVFVKNGTPDKKPTPTPTPSYSGGGRSSGGSRQASNNTIAGTLAGQWMQDGTGWWFRLDDGSYAVNSWQYVAYNGVAKWYRFDANGYICKGWYTDADGHRYYLNPVSDGQMGAMLTGWQQIDGIWYYFNTVSDGTQGALLVNTTTPDGYNVDANGQWIQ